MTASELTPEERAFLEEGHQEDGATHGVLAIDLAPGQTILVDSPGYPTTIKTVASVEAQGGWMALHFTDGTGWQPRATRTVYVLEGGAK